MIATVTEMITMSQNARSTLKRVILAVSLVLCASSAFAQGTPVPYTIPQYFDANGDPLALGGICTYEAGTTTLANVYTTSALAVAFPNPVRLNASGRPSVSGVTLGIFLSPGRAYKFVLKDATVTTCSPDTGVTLWSVDNVQAVPGSGSSLDVTGTAGEAISAGDVVYMSTGDGGTNVGQWYKTDADFTTKSTSTFQVGVAPSAIAAAATGTIRISGSVTVAGPLSTGAAYYAGATAGAMVTTPPANALRIGQAASATELIVGRYVAPVSPRGPPCGRLTLTTGLPVTTADVTGASATTLYYAPYGGCNQIDLFDGTTWARNAFAQISIAVPATTSQMYDVFAYDNAGVVALELTAWTNDTTRATALVAQNGVWVKTGVTTRLYLGSFRTTTVSGQTEDSQAKRFVYNYYNRVRRSLMKTDTTANWSYTLATIRQARATATNQVEIVNGVAEDVISISVRVPTTNSTNRAAVLVTIGENSTTAGATGVVGGNNKAGVDGSNSAYATLIAELVKVPPVGYSYYAWLEASEVAGTEVWYGGPLLAGGASSGLSGWVVQ
jgi:hypothetical protein